ncbi:hypothetical protein HZA87_04890 [Candidatus Uhrbacteria bacterium]|nr:hypothetical protein [Candidatus Uhrbacteria bacterium]
MQNRSILSQELTTYQSEKARLLAESNGKFVLVKGTDIIGVYVSQDDALQEGYRRFGNTEFLVKQITALEEFSNFSRAIA